MEWGFNNIVSIANPHCHTPILNLFLSSHVFIFRPPPHIHNYVNVDSSYAYSDNYTPRPPSRPEAAYKGLYIYVGCFANVDPHLFGWKWYGVIVEGLTDECQGEPGQC